MASIIKLEENETKRFKRKLSAPETPEEFEIFQIYLKSFSRNYDVYRNINESDCLEFTVSTTKKQETTRVFTKSLRVFECSCLSFVKNELQFCEHIAVLYRIRNNILSNKTSQKDLSVFRGFKVLFSMLPTKGIKFNGMKTEVFNPKTKQTQIIGCRSNEIKKSIAYKTLQKQIDLKVFRKRLKELEKQKVSSKRTLKNVTLYDYQEDIFKKMLAAKKSICSMVMGSGKTLTTIALYEWVRRNRKPDSKILIVAPKSLKSQWIKEIESNIDAKTFSVDNFRQLDVLNNDKEIDAFVITYQLLTKHIDDIKNTKFDMIVFDEMQFIRNNNTKAWRALKKLRSEYMVGLSGTIIENRLNDLYSAIEILTPGFLGPVWKFQKLYQDLYKINKNTIIFRGAKNIEDLKSKLASMLFSFDDLKLPNITHSYIHNRLSGEERVYHDKYMNLARPLQAKAIEGTIKPSEKMILQSFLLKARQSSNTKQLITKEKGLIESDKILTCLELINDICNKQNQNLVIFSSWVEMLDIIKEHITKKFPNINCLMFTGKQSLDKRTAAVDEFKNSSGGTIFLASDAGGLGVDGLQYACNNIIHFELPWNPAKIDQRNARLHRIGQKNNVDIFYLLSEDSIETSIYETLKEKRDIRETVLYDKV
jgi:SNF2 family DNA or RNA helicase